MSWTETRRWTDARALLHVPDQINIARLRHAHALALVLVPVLAWRAELWLWLTKAFAILSAPIRLVTTIRNRPSGASTSRLKADAAARMVVKEVVRRANLRETSTFAGYIVEILAGWAALNHAGALADLLVPKIIRRAADFEVGACACVFVKVHRLWYL